MICSDDPVVMYLEFADEFYKLEPHSKLSLIQTTEKQFLSEADTPVGEFLNDLFVVLVEAQNNDNLHQILEDMIDYHSLDDELVTLLNQTMMLTVHGMKKQKVW